jgi:uncharacterized protein YgiM (DUF1202 family)
MMNKKLWFLFAVFMVMLSVASIALAQDDDGCGVLVEEAITLASDNCFEIGRNQVCYGNNQIEAQGWTTEDIAFSVPGDVLDVGNLATLNTSALDEDAGTWGVALMKLQANLPDTLPGQAVTIVLFGDVELQNDVNPDALVEIPTITVTANTNANLRSGAGTDFAVAGSLTTGQELVASGRNEAGDWLLITVDGEPAWVFASLVNTTDDVMTLNVSDDADTTSSIAPMQAFTFSTGIQESTCAEAPRDGLLVQAPTDTVVNFTINGVEVEIGSTALMRLGDDAESLSVANLAGNVVVTANGNTQALDVSFQTSVTTDGTVSEPEPIAFDDVRALPVNLLPETVTIVPPGRIYRSLSMFCQFIDDGSDTTTAGEPIVVRDGWNSVTQEDAAGLLAVPLSVDYDGQSVELWGFTGPTPVLNDEGNTEWAIARYWVIEDPQPGSHTIQINGIDGIFSGYEAAPCTINVR